MLQNVSDKTADGTPCVFPFHGKKNDKTSREFYGCTDYDASARWCATEVNTDNTYSDWGWC